MGGHQDSPPLKDDVENLQCSESYRFPREFLEAQLATARESSEPYLEDTCRWILSNRSRASSAWFAVTHARAEGTITQW